MYYDWSKVQYRTEDLRGGATNGTDCLSGALKCVNSASAGILTIAVPLLLVSPDVFGTIWSRIQQYEWIEQSSRHVVGRRSVQKEMLHIDFDQITGLISRVRRSLEFDLENPTVALLRKELSEAESRGDGAKAEMHAKTIEVLDQRRGRVEVDYGFTEIDAD